MTALLCIDSATLNVRRYEYNAKKKAVVTHECVLSEGFEAEQGRVALQEFLANPGSLEVAHGPEAA